MIEKEIHQVLLGADKFLPQGEYLSLDFDVLAAIDEVKALADVLASLNCETVLYDGVQDATLFADLWCSQQVFNIRFLLLVV